MEMKFNIFPTQDAKRVVLVVDYQEQHSSVRSIHIPVEAVRHLAEALRAVADGRHPKLTVRQYVGVWECLYD